MISILALGRLAATPEVRTGPSGKAYTTARLLCPGEGGDTSVSLIAFGETGEHLATIPQGVSVSVTGRAKLTRWTAKDGTERSGLAASVDAILYARAPRRGPRPPSHDEDDEGIDELDEYGEPRLRRQRRPASDEEAEL